MVVIRLARGGAKKRPFYNVVVTDSRSRRDGRFIERVGFYNPVAAAHEEGLRIAHDRVDYWRAARRETVRHGQHARRSARAQARATATPAAAQPAAQAVSAPAEAERSSSGCARQPDLGRAIADRRHGPRGGTAWRARRVQGPAAVGRSGVAARISAVVVARARCRRVAAVPGVRRAACIPARSSPSSTASRRARRPARCAARRSACRATLLPALAEDEYYQADLVGMTVVNRDGEVLGAVVDFVESGAHPIVRVAGQDGGERLIPWVAQYIDRVDVAARRIDVDWPADY